MLQGFGTFLRRFRHRSFEIIRPLPALVNKDKQWRKGLEKQKAFALLKKEFTLVLIIQNYGADTDAVLESDTSDWAKATVLSQVFQDTLLHLVAYS